MHTFTLVFLTALALTTLIQIWLATRHIRHIRAHQNTVPEKFSSQINLADHQKAADYTCAKTRDERPNLYYPIRNPLTGKEVLPFSTRV